MKKSKLKKIAVAACALSMLVPVAAVPFLTACNPEELPPIVDEVAVVTSLTLGTTGVKTTYAYGEEFTTAGLTVTANMSDGTTETLPLAMCSVSTPDTKVPGVKTVTVTYKNVKATYNITVAERQMPSISTTPLATINGDNIYRVEAEDIDLAVSGVKTAGEGNALIVETEGEEVSGGKYLANYGVAENYFGFTFTADKEYKNATLLFRAANPTANVLGIGTNMNMYLNYKSSTDNYKFNISDLTVLDAAQKTEGEDGVVMEWATRIIRGVTIPQGTNTLTFDIIGSDVVCLDYIEIYAGVPYGTNSVTELTGMGTVIKDVEDFDLEKIVVRSDVKNAHGLANGQAFVETATTNPNGTHGGKAVGAMAQGSEITTALRLEDKATVHILYSTASIGGYVVKDNYEFYMDGELMTGVEDYYVKAGQSGPSQWWEWRDTSIGFVDLEAGDHIFTVKVTGSDCNCDCFKFDVLSYGEFITHPEKSARIMINDLGTYVMEGENIDLFAKDGTQYIKSENGHYNILSANNVSGGRAINGFNEGTKFMFTLYSYKNAKVDIAMNAVRPNAEENPSVAESLKLYLGETELTVSDKADELHDSDWRKIILAEGVTLEAGKLYTFTMEITNSFWLDYISFVTTEYNGVQPTLGSIKLGTSDVAKIYETGDTFSYEGLTVTGVMTNDVTFPVDLQGVTVTAPDMTTAGEKTVTVSYEGKTATYTILVHGPVEGISLNTDGAKTTYSFGDNFSANGIVVIANTGNGTTMNIALADCSISIPNMYTIGTQTITVTYGEFTADYEITVNPAESEVTINGNGSFEKSAPTLKKDHVVTRPDFIPAVGAGNFGSNGDRIYGFTTGTIFDVILEVEEDCTVDIDLSLFGAGRTVGNTLVLKMDGVVLETDPDTAFPGDLGTISVASAQLTKGQHVFTIEVLSPNWDFQKIIFTASQYGGESPEVPETPEVGGEVETEVEAILNDENN